MNATLPPPLFRRLGAIFGLLLLAGCAHQPASRGPATEGAVRKVLTQQAESWNRGDLAGFMDGYARGDATRFASGGDVTLGWQTVFDRYARRYRTAEAMGQLTFSEISVTALSDDAALVFGRWTLVRAKDQPTGLFSLIFRRTSDGWRIVHDHTSSATP